MTVHRAGRAWWTPMFALALCGGSALLFLIELMFGRLVLPKLGGVPAVWNTCLVFFQLTLLLGYLYAWASTRWLSIRSQLVLHIVLLAAAYLVLPVRIVPSWPPPADANPVPWLLAVLAVSIGLPFFVVSTTAPVLQHWFANTAHPDAKDPYFLYQASNLGSMIGLAGYPLLVEPWLGVTAQGIAWAAGYGVFAVTLAGCAAVVWRGRLPGGGSPALTPDISGPTPPLSTLDTAAEPTTPPPAHPSWRQAARWTTLAAVPSSLLLGVTTHLSTDVAVVPLLWVIPLLLYLLTFVLAFAPRPWAPTRVLAIIFPLLVIPLGLEVTLHVRESAWGLVLLNLATFTVAAWLCHQRLAEDRPPARYLTVFYLCLSIGGAIGGLFNALAAPILFPQPYEYPLALVAVCLLKPYRGAETRRARVMASDVWMPAVLGVAVFLALLTLGREWTATKAIGTVIVVGVSALVCVRFSPRPVRFGLGFAAVLAAASAQSDVLGSTVRVERSFFGVHRVAEDPASQLRLLFHGSTLHGAQHLDPARTREPETYYTRAGPAGQIFEAVASRPGQAVAIVGLGTGTLAAYARPGQSWTFFEIDPVVVGLARDSGYFSFLRAAAAPVRIVVGDARLSLAAAPPRSFDLIVLDAFSSDALPVHLMTREALRLYASRLRPGGVVVFHASSRFLQLQREFLALANDAGMAHLRQFDRGSEQFRAWTGWAPSDWIVLAGDHTDFGALASDRRWGRIPGAPARLWTDDYSNPLALFRWR